MKYQWHIFLASLNPAKGSEQAGRRPVLVVSRESINQMMDSIALCYQIRTLDKSRLEEDVAELVDEELRQEIIEALRFQLDI